MSSVIAAKRIISRTFFGASLAYTGYQLYSNTPIAQPMRQLPMPGFFSLGLNA